MSWNIDRIRSPKRRKRDAPTHSSNKNIKFSDYLTQKYSETISLVEQEKLQLEQSLQKLLEEQKSIESNPSRGLIRKKRQIEKQIEEVKKKIEDLSQGGKIEEYKEKIVPYTEAYERELQVQAIEKMRETIQGKSLLPKEEDLKNKLNMPSGVMKDFIHKVEQVASEVTVMQNEICEECDDIMILESRSSVLICSCCGNWKRYLDATSLHMAYGEEVEFIAFAYARSNHFNERLTYSQAKESTRISIEDLNKVMAKLMENRILDPEKITPEITYAAAKELKMRHIYKQNTQLWCQITGKPPPRLSPEQEEQLRAMFRAVNRLWLKYKPEERKNFLSYNYLLHKFCELLNFPDNIKRLYKLLKGDKKLEKQDEIFKQVCEDPELDWEFIPSKNDI
jgi:hypothetical protein